MPAYLVEWSIDIDAETPEEAAKLALEIQRDPESQGLFFEVTDDGKGWVAVIQLSEYEQLPAAHLFDYGMKDHKATGRYIIMPIEDLVPLLVAEFDACLEANQ